MSAVTGSLVSMLFELTPFIGLPYTVTALVVVILGGLGNVLGSLAGAPPPRARRDRRRLRHRLGHPRHRVATRCCPLILILRPSGLFGR